MGLFAIKVILFTAAAFSAGSAQKCGPGQIGPFKTVITMYVSKKEGDKESYATSSRKEGKDGKWTGKFCDKDGAGDQAASPKYGPPSQGRFKGSKEGNFSGAIAQKNAYFGRNMRIVGGKYDGLQIFASDTIGKLNGGAVQGSGMPQIDLSTTCDEYEKNTEGVTPAEVCIDAPGGTPAGLEPPPKRHDQPAPRPARRQR